MRWRRTNPRNGQLQARSPDILRTPIRCTAYSSDRLEVHFRVGERPDRMATVSIPEPRGRAERRKGYASSSGVRICSNRVGGPRSGRGAVRAQGPGTSEQVGHTVRFEGIPEYGSVPVSASPMTWQVESVDAPRYFTDEFTQPGPGCGRSPPHCLHDVFVFVVRYLGAFVVLR